MTERPKINFITYIFMMYQSGLVALGKLENPLSKQKTAVLEEARGIIELLEILDEKTKGNLTTEEEKTMKMVLDTLRMNFVEEAKKQVTDLPGGQDNKDGKNEIH